MQRQYSIALDLLLSSVAASAKGKYEKAAKLYDAALRSPDFAKTLATLDKEQGDALAAYKAAKAATAAAPKKDDATAKKEENATPGQRMSSFLSGLHAKREAAKVKAPAKKAVAVADPSKKSAPAPAAKKTEKADAQDDEFDSIINEMTEASTIDQILDPALDLTDDGVDNGGGDDTSAIPRPTPTVNKADADPSPGNGESDLDTDQDDLMDLDLADLTDLSDDDFGDETAASEDDEDEDEDEDSDDDKKSEEDASSDDDEDDEDEDEDEDDKDDKKDDKKLPPFMKKDDKKEDATATKNVKAAFTQTINNLSALDRLTTLTASMVDGTIKKKQTAKAVASSKKPAVAPAKPASKK